MNHSHNKAREEILDLIIVRCKKCKSKMTIVLPTAPTLFYCSDCDRFGPAEV